MEMKSKMMKKIINDTIFFFFLVYIIMLEITKKDFYKCDLATIIFGLIFLD